VNAPRGIDVSHHNGVVDWAKVVEAGYSFAFVKATEGQTWRDPRFVENWARARAAGVYVGAYHFAAIKDGDLSVGDAQAEARWFCQTVGQLVEGHLPPVLDVETYVEGGSGRPLIAWVQAFLAEVEFRLGRTPVVYCGPNYWRWMLRQTAELRRYPLWQVQYTSATTPTVMTGWDRWTFWQHTSKGRVPGIEGNVDLNRYSGDEVSLMALAGIQPCSAAGVA
jgi:lysozyme